MPNSHNMDRDHVVMLEKLDKMILHAETEEVDTGLRRRMYALRNLLVIHAGKAQDIKDELTQLIAKNRKRILLIGATITSLIVVPYFVLTRTTLFSPKPIGCKEFPTKSVLYPSKIEVCLNGVTKAYSVENGDVELDLTFMRSPIERVQADVVFWIANKLGEKVVEYDGEYNIDRVRIYENGFLVSDDREKKSGWIYPLVPEDVRMPMWKYIHSLRPRFIRDRPPLEEKLSKTVDNLGALVATLGSIGITAFRFFRVGRGM